MKHTIWSNDVDVIKDIASDLVDAPSEEAAWYRATELNAEYLEDERVNLDIDVGEDIIAIADLGLWDGRRSGYKIVGRNLKDCVSVATDCETIDWYVDDDGDVRLDGVHHDGTNHVLFRAWKNGISDASKDIFTIFLMKGLLTKEDIDRITIPLGDFVKKVYGW